MKIIPQLVFLFTFLTLYAQPKATKSYQIQESIAQKQRMAQNSLAKNILFENIGPTVMSGRVVDLAVNPNNPNEFYVAYASGGLWHTTSNGSSFEPIMDNAPTQNIGDIAVHWPTKTIWVGTGENNASRSSYAGMGLFKSNDNGKSWQFVGLPDSHHIGRILINPNNSKEVVVGVTGHLYSKNKERGIYKTKDAGQTWEQTLYVNDSTGIIDLQSTPNNFNVLYSTAWSKDRKAWNFRGSGSHSAIYKSTDAGETWELISNKNSGFPTGNGVGRIGLTVYNNNLLYAIVDNQERRPQKQSKKQSKKELSKEDFKSMSNQEFLALGNKQLNQFLQANNFKKAHKAKKLKKMLKTGQIIPKDLAKYLEDANSQMFDTEVVGAQVYVSKNAGKTWEKTHKGYLDDLYYSYGYYFGRIHVSPKNKDHIYIYGVPILKSKDGGKTFQSMSAENVHVDHHTMWINPNNPDHLIIGNDGGVNITYNDGRDWIKNNTTAVGQFYTIATDNSEPYLVYGGLQDNGVWVGPHNAKTNKKWQQTGKYAYEQILSGDGMQIQIDSRNPDLVYTGNQYGNYRKINRKTKHYQAFNIKPDLGNHPFRFNWQTPILLSPHNQDIVYLGGNQLFRSMNQGKDWQSISQDLTNGGRFGNVAYGTITSLDESKFAFGMIFLGTDDGLVWHTKDSGSNWEQIQADLPKDLWVSRIVASKHKKGRVYLCLNGYRWDDFTPYIYQSNDFGKNWRSIASNLPYSPINVIVEDPENQNVLYLGTDNGAYVSWNQGQTWELFSSNTLPPVAVHDLSLQNRDKHLLLGTHGRSIYKTSIAGIQQIDSTVLNNSVSLLQVDSIQYPKNFPKSNNHWKNLEKPKLTIELFSSKNQKAKIVIQSKEGRLLHTIQTELNKGINLVYYDLLIDEKTMKSLAKLNPNNQSIIDSNGLIYLPKGGYKIVLNKQEKPFQIN